MGEIVKTADGLGTVTDVNLITGNLMVKSLEGDYLPVKYHRSQVKPTGNKK